MRLESVWNTAHTTGDAETLDRLWANDLEVEVPGMTPMTKAESLAFARTYLPVEIFFAAGLFYLLIAFVLVQAFKLLERWLRVDACQGR